MIYQNMSHADYLAIEAASSSGLQTIAKRSPYAFRNATDEPTDAMALGTLAHSLILQPERESEYAIAPKFDRRTKEGKAGAAQFEADCAGKTIVSRDDWDLAHAMRDAVMSRPHTRDLLMAPGRSEISVILDHPEAHVQCKCRPDRLLDGYPLIIDIKKVGQTVSKSDFLRSCWRYGHVGQAWWYPHLLGLETGERHYFVFIAVEESPPHDVALYDLTDRELADGEAIIRKGLDMYQRCIKAGIWPGIGWDWDSMSYRLETIGRED